MEGPDQNSNIRQGQDQEVENRAANEASAAEISVPAPTPSSVLYLNVPVPVVQQDPRIHQQQYNRMTGISEFEAGRQIGRAEGASSGLPTELSRIEHELRIVKAQRDYYRDELISKKSELSISRENAADLLSQLQTSMMGHLSESGRATTDRSNLSSVTPSFVSTPVRDLADDAESGQGPSESKVYRYHVELPREIPTRTGLDIKDLLYGLFDQVEIWAGNFAGAYLDSLKDAPGLQDLGGRILKQNFEDMVLDGEQRPFVIAAIINASIVPFLGSGMLDKLDVFGRNKELNDYKALIKHEHRCFPKFVGALEHRAAIVRKIAQQYEYNIEVDNFVDEITSMHLTAFAELIPAGYLEQAETQFETLIKDAFRIALDMGSTPSNWFVDAAYRRDAFDSKTMAAINPPGGTVRLEQLEKDYNVRFGVRPSIKEEWGALDGERMVMKKTVVILKLLPGRKKVFRRKSKQQHARSASMV